MSLLALASSRSASSRTMRLITQLTPEIQQQRIQAFRTSYDEIKNSYYARSTTTFDVLFDEMIGFWQRNCGSLETQSKNDLVGLILIIAIEELRRFSFVEDDSPRSVLSFFTDLYQQGASPNTFVEEIFIGDNTFRNVELFQIVYLCWKTLYYGPLPEDVDQDYSNLFTRMIRDHRTDLLANFVESYAGFEHFISDSNRRCGPGYTFESTTLAHYALTIKDYTSASQMIELDNRLITSKCIMMFGRSLLSEQVLDISEIAQQRFPIASSEQSNLSESDYDIDWELARIREIGEELQYLDPEDPISGVLAMATYSHDHPFENVRRITNISLLHIAARNADIRSCYFLMGKNSNILEVDSSNATPFAYLQQSCEDKFVHKRALGDIPDLRPRQATLRRTLPTASQVIIKSGYEILYNPAFKMAHYTRERLSLRSLLPGDGTRSGLSFHVEKSVSKLIRAADNDYTNSGLDRGHLRAAANCTRDRDLLDSFYLSNICPQDPELNQGYWKKLEARIRSAVFKNDLVEVYTGPIFDLKEQPFRLMGKNKIPVPTHFFKVIHMHNRESTTVALIIPNRPIDGSTKLESFQVTLEKIHELTGVSFAIAARTA